MRDLYTYNLIYDQKSIYNIFIQNIPVPTNILQTIKKKLTSKYFYYPYTVQGYLHRMRHQR